MDRFSTTDTCIGEQIRAMVEREERYLCIPPLSDISRSPTGVVPERYSLSRHEMWREHTCEWMYKVRKELFKTVFNDPDISTLVCCI